MSMELAKKIQEVISASGGRVVGKTRLQKMFFILKASGFDFPFSFSYKHYGPYSEELASTTSIAEIFGLISETEQRAQWGGVYTIYETSKIKDISSLSDNQPFLKLVQTMSSCNSVELELAATALFLKINGIDSSWDETANRKPEKSKFIDNAKLLYQNISSISLPRKLPSLA